MFRFDFDTGRLCRCDHDFIENTVSGQRSEIDYWYCFFVGEGRAGSRLLSLLLHCAAGRVRNLRANEYHEGPPNRVRINFAAVAFVRNIYEYDVGIGPRQLHERAHVTAQPTD